jgi:hypothetical protein
MEREVYKTNTIEDTELIYTILREKYPNKQIEIEFNDNTKDYTLRLTDSEFKFDPEVPLNVTIKVIYGDSITGESPLLLMKNDQVYVETIQSIFGENDKIEYPGFKMFDKTIRLEKEFSFTDYKIWSDIGWVNIKKVIRHKCDKKIYKVLTHTGYVKVTEDHSLINENKEFIKPKECNLNTKLLCSYPSEFNETCKTISKDRAFIYGFFYGDGSCDRYECPSGLKYSWALNNADMDVLNNLKNLLQKEYPDNTPVIYNTIESSGVYKLTMNNPKFLIDEYREKFYDSDRYKKVPTEILNSNNEIIQSFFDGYWAADGCRKDKETIGCTRFDNKGQIGSAGLYYLMKKLGYNVSLNTRSDKEKMLRITVTKKKQRKVGNQIKKIEFIEHNNYVYDIETDIGRFQAGVGDIIVKNTDSVFLSIKFNRKDFEQNRKDAFKLAIQCGDNITNDVFRRPPIDLEFEKVYQPFILLTKKRYIGKKYEDTRDPLKLKTLTTSGIAITKRNYCNMVKKCYKQVIDIIMDSSDLDEAISVYKRYIDRIDNYQIDTEDLVISAQIGKEYSCKTCKKKVEWIIKCDKCKTLNPKMEPICKGTLKNKPCNKKFECLHTFSLGHINLAQKFLFRNDEICIGDRIQYIFVENENTNVKSELTEDPTFAKNNNIKYNRGCYLEQLAKSIMGFFKVVLQNEDELIDDLLEFTNEKLVEYGSTKLKISDFKITDE